MEFYKKPKANGNEDGKRHAVYMEHERQDHYVCDMVDGDDEEAAAINSLGLTLRVRLTRSKGKYAMLEGEIFNPERLLRAACDVTDYKTKAFTGGEYKKGYTLLTVTADGCTNKYMIFDERILESLLKSIKTKMK